MRAMIRSLQGPWLADVAANLLAMTLMVVIALARVAAVEPPADPALLLQVRPVQPIGGADAVELLRLRLLPGRSGDLDLGPEGPDPSDEVRTLYILHPAAHPAVAAALKERGQDWRELTVPEALKTAENGWHPDFLALAEVADDADAFRASLQDLLTDRARAGAMPESEALGGRDTGLRLWRWLEGMLTGLRLLALLAALWGLTRLHRWALKA